MTIFQKTRELAEMILISEESKNVADTRANYLADKNAVEKMEQYRTLQEKIQNKEDLTESELHADVDRLKSMGVELKKDAVIGQMIEAENQFNGLVNQVMHILKAAITGEEQEGCSGCGSNKGCNGCK